MNHLFNEKIEQLKKELDYQQILESCCKRVIEQYNPCPSQCNLDHFYNNGRLDKIHVKIDDRIVSVIVCGKFIESDDPMKLHYTKPYELDLTGDHEWIRT